MKKSRAILLSALLAAGSISAAIPGSVSAAGDEPLSIVATIFPEYDWVMNILGDQAENAKVTLLLNSGVDLHSYQPTAKDILTISGCDLFIYVGGESDKWVEDALAEATNKDMMVINLLDSLGEAVKAEEIVEGMERDHDHEHESEEEHEHEHEADDEHEHEHESGEEHEHEHEAEEDHEHEEELDEHVWLSLKNAAALCGVISSALEELDPDNAEVYQNNVTSYQEQLLALDEEYAAATEAAQTKTILFGDRFPFRYLVDDYGLDYYAAFSGCSAETEASFETVIFLANKVDELGLPAIMTIEGANHRIAETIRDTTKDKNQEILVLNSLQSATTRDAAEGTTYLSIMEQNLEVLKEALK